MTDDDRVLEGTKFRKRVCDVIIVRFRGKVTGNVGGREENNVVPTTC